MLPTAGRYVDGSGTSHRLGGGTDVPVGRRLIRRWRHGPPVPRNPFDQGRPAPTPGMTSARVSRSRREPGAAKQTAPSVGRWVGGGGQAGGSGDGEPAVGVEVVAPAGGLVFAAVVGGAVAGEVGRGGGSVGPAGVAGGVAGGGHGAAAAGEAAAPVGGAQVAVEVGGGAVAVGGRGWAEAGLCGEVVGAGGGSAAAGGPRAVAGAAQSG